MAMPRPDLEEIAAGLCEAVERSNLDSVRRQLQFNHIPPEAIVEKTYAVRGSRYMTALHYAVEDTSKNGSEILRILLRFLKDIKGPPSMKPIEVLGDGEVKIDGEEYPIDESYTPLAWACLHANSYAVKELVRHGADVNSQASQGKLTPLMAVCARTGTNREQEVNQIITHLIDVGKANVNLTDDDLNGAHHYYFQHQPHPKLDQIRKLMNGLKSRFGANIYGWTALHLCARYCRGTRAVVHLHAVSVTIPPAELDRQDSYGRMPIDVAWQWRNNDMIRLLTQGTAGQPSGLSIAQLLITESKRASSPSHDVLNRSRVFGRKDSVYKSPPSPEPVILVQRERRRLRPEPPGYNRGWDLELPTGRLANPSKELARSNSQYGSSSRELTELREPREIEESREQRGQREDERERQRRELMQQLAAEESIRPSVSHQVYSPTYGTQPSEQVPGTYYYGPTSPELNLEAYQSGRSQSSRRRRVQYD
ncbi:MAG: hypothetical protein M1814_003178 [Vezdaea aestivalis]|nr:MAG: hypothetical protein M1814_003178 [Vezdaea aestivalis]